MAEVDYLKRIMYGCINEDMFSFRSPRMIDTDECETLEEAFDVARQMVEDGAETVTICRCKFIGEDGNGCWHEIPGDGTIEIDSRNCSWLEDDDEEDDDDD